MSDGDALLAWAVDPHKKLHGFLVFDENNRPVARETLTFEEGFCVSYGEIFVAGSGTAGTYRCTVQISAVKPTLGAAVKDSAWSQTR